MRNKIIIVSLSLVALISLFAGCSSSSKATTVIGTHEIIREAALGSTWQMYQIRVALDVGSQFDILLTLADGNKVDGYFFAEKGSGVVFQIKTNSTVVYQSGTLAGSSSLTSDRFSFTANQGNGNTYIINLKNNSSDSKTTTFIELVYPSTGEIYIPLEAK
jgi:hypothetical protein